MGGKRGFKGKWYRKMKNSCSIHFDESLTILLTIKQRIFLKCGSKNKAITPELLLYVYIL
jgi:hypothetical protein